MAVQKPGHRPWAWWVWEASEPRRVLNRPRDGRVMGEVDRHRPGEIWIGGGRLGELVPWLEPEPVYLRRLRLLLPGESTRIDWEEVAEMMRTD
jgi:hypothetical protein